jgi:hypothetical protein
MYTSYLTTIIDSHRTHITCLRWFPKGYIFNKQNLSYNSSSTTCNALATIAEDGQCIIWDIKDLMDTNKINKPDYTIRPVIRVELNKMDCKF